MCELLFQIISVYAERKPRYALTYFNKRLKRKCMGVAEFYAT